MHHQRGRSDTRPTKLLVISSIDRGPHCNVETNIDDAAERLCRHMSQRDSKLPNSPRSVGWVATASSKMERSCASQGGDGPRWSQSRSRLNTWIQERLQLSPAANSTSHLRSARSTLTSNLSGNEPDADTSAHQMVRALSTEAMI